MAAKHQETQQQAVIRHAQDDLGGQIPGRIQPAQGQGTLREIAGGVKQWWDDLRIGQGHFAAWVRAGFKELAQALPAFPDSNIRPVEEPGLAGNPTPQIITSEMGASPLANDNLPMANDNRPYTQALDDAAARAQQQTPERSQSRGM